MSFPTYNAPYNQNGEYARTRQEHAEYMLLLPRSPQNAKEIRHMLTLSNTKVVIVEDAAIAQRLEENVPDLMQAMQLKIVTGKTASIASYFTLNDLISDAANDKTFEVQSRTLGDIPRTGEDIVFIWFTSGTTSLPKAAPHTNRSLTANIDSWRETFKLDDQRAWLHARESLKYTTAIEQVSNVFCQCR